eukprot:6196069-Pleurochrysis_carterae.AAC.1
MWKLRPGDTPGRGAVCELPCLQAGTGITDEATAISRLRKARKQRVRDARKQQQTAQATPVPAPRPKPASAPATP